MTSTDINIAIAEELGWHIEYSMSGWPPGCPHDYPAQVVPNFHASLDACAQFEATLGDSDFDLYIYELTQRFGRTMRATAPQRCQAFLRLRGKWIE